MFFSLALRGHIAEPASNHCEERLSHNCEPTLAQACLVFIVSHAEEAINALIKEHGERIPGGRSRVFSLWVAALLHSEMMSAH